MGTQPPSPKTEQSPQIFSPCLLLRNGKMYQDGTWHGGRPQPRQLYVRWGPSPPPNFRPISIVAKRLGCTKMPLRTELGLSRGDFVLDGEPAPSPKRGRSPVPIFGPNGWMHQDATWYGGRHDTGYFMFDGNPPPPQKGSKAPNYRPMSIAAKWLHGSRCHLVRR